MKQEPMLACSDREAHEMRLTQTRNEAELKFPSGSRGSAAGWPLQLINADTIEGKSVFIGSIGPSELPLLPASRWVIAFNRLSGNNGS